jgi:predicted transcriptional regulator
MIIMVELTDEEKKVVEAMKMLKATSPETVKTVDQIAKAAVGLPKGKVANLLLGLVNKKIVKRVAREKAAGYYLTVTNI